MEERFYACAIRYLASGSDECFYDWALDHFSHDDELLEEMRKEGFVLNLEPVTSSGISGLSDRGSVIVCPETDTGYMESWGDFDYTVFGLERSTADGLGVSTERWINIGYSLQGSALRVTTRSPVNNVVGHPLSTLNGKVSRGLVYLIEVAFVE